MPSPTRKRGSHPRIRDARPDILTLAEDPQTVGNLTLGSDKRVWWLCDRKHRWRATPCDRIISGRGCPYCSGRLPIPGETDLATTHPALAGQVRGVDPVTLSAGSDRRVAWECARGHHWSAAVNNRALRGSGCPYCSGRLPIVGETDFKTTEPLLSAEVVDVDPTTFTRSSNKSVTWRCSLGHLYTATPNTRTNMGSGCPYCAGKKFLAGFNDLLTMSPPFAAELVGIDPATIWWRSAEEVEWECGQCRTHWMETVRKRTRGDRRTGCSACHKNGFNINAPAVLYVLMRTTATGEQLKVGITRNLRERMVPHRRRGWKVLDVSDEMLGRDALDIEQRFLRHLDSHNVPRGARGHRGEPGFTESWFAADYPLTGIAEILDTINPTKAA